ncbi:hypothetical protein [Streptomyces alboniger]|nr:hypothetical protein [Streptomyces alboniger]
MTVLADTGSSASASHRSTDVERPEASTTRSAVTSADSEVPWVR